MIDEIIEEFYFRCEDNIQILLNILKDEKFNNKPEFEILIEELLDIKKIPDLKNINEKILPCNKEVDPLHNIVNNKILFDYNNIIDESNSFFSIKGIKKEIFCKEERTDLVFSMYVKYTFNNINKKVCHIDPEFLCKKYKCNCEHIVNINNENITESFIHEGVCIGAKTNILVKINNIIDKKFIKDSIYYLAEYSNKERKWISIHELKNNLDKIEEYEFKNV